jgi:hypothetical protein
VSINLRPSSSLEDVLYLENKLVYVRRRYHEFCVRFFE